MLLTTFLLCLPIVLVAAALMVIFAARARTFRAAQTSLSLLMLVPSLPGMALAFQSARPPASLYAVPFLGQQMIVNELVRGTPLVQLPGAPRHRVVPRRWRSWSAPSRSGPSSGVSRSSTPERRQSRAPTACRRAAARRCGSAAPVTGCRNSSEAAWSGVRSSAAPPPGARHGRRLPVVRVDEQGVAGVGEVDAHLVGSPRGRDRPPRGWRAAPKESDRTRTKVVEGRAPGSPLPGPHPPLPARGDRDVDAQVAGHGSPDERQVALRDLVPLEERRRGCGGRRRCARGAARRSCRGRAGGPPRADRAVASASSRTVRSGAPRARDDDAPGRLGHRGELRRRRGGPRGVT